MITYCSKQLAASPIPPHSVPIQVSIMYIQLCRIYRCHLSFYVEYIFNYTNFTFLRTIISYKPLRFKMVYGLLTPLSSSLEIMWQMCELLLCLARTSPSIVINAAVPEVSSDPIPSIHTIHAPSPLLHQMHASQSPSLYVSHPSLLPSSIRQSQPQVFFPDGEPNASMHTQDSSFMQSPGSIINASPGIPCSPNIGLHL